MRERERERVKVKEKKKKNTSDFCERRILKFRLIRILFTIRRDSFEIPLVEKIPLDIFPRGAFLYGTSLSSSPCAYVETRQEERRLRDDDRAPRLGLDEGEREGDLFHPRSRKSRKKI